MQHCSHLLMIQPVQFNFNAETAVNNSFQVNSNDQFTQEKAQKEFDEFIAKLRLNGVDVTVVKDSINPFTPDSIFPNNWISFHANGSICLYPMFAENRRLERKQSVLDVIQNKFIINQTIDFTGFESESLFLEGTGSMVLDRENNIAFACISPRTNKIVLDNFCQKMNYQAISFLAMDGSNKPIYHTNVMMCVADKYVVICLDSIKDAIERELVVEKIISTQKTIIEIGFEQMNQFAGNMLQVHNNKGERFLVMSSQAYNALTVAQIAVIESFNKIIHSAIKTIETNGGGSARCMMAEVFLQLK